MYTLPSQGCTLLHVALPTRGRWLGVNNGANICWAVSFKADASAKASCACGSTPEKLFRSGCNVLIKMAWTSLIWTMAGSKSGSGRLLMSFIDMDEANEKGNGVANLVHAGVENR